MKDMEQGKERKFKGRLVSVLDKQEGQKDK